MARPATKRRKLSHDSESESASEDGSLNGTFDDADVTEDDGDDVSMGDLNELDELEEEDSDDVLSMEDDDDEEDEGKNDGKDSENEVSEAATKPAPNSKTEKTKKAHGKPEAQLQDGVYTAETFKSNVFKLQVDELLGQVKPKYGKKEAPAENVMRTLKTLIEQLPSRAPLSVRTIRRQKPSSCVI